MIKIETKKVSPEKFQKFGKVVNTPSGLPTSESSDYKFWSDIADYKIEGETEIGICTVYRQEETTITGMERHLRTPEILIPIDGAFVLPLLIEGEDEQSAESFRVEIGEAVKINDAVWHGACLPADKDESSYFVIFRKGTPHEDVQKKDIRSIKVIL
ncbi:MAG TPA: ureidoglycolate lyase [Ignavibacteriaceae bacterium]|jgi:ureidoglycolate hydrolase|nr:ureidoglycolate lyase [Ignavibacteriaceae bacterium]